MLKARDFSFVSVDPKGISPESDSVASVEVSRGPDGCRACTALYDKPPHCLPACRGVALQSEDGSAPLGC